MKIFEKQPAELLDYDVVYCEWLTCGDAIESATVDVLPTGLTVESVFTDAERVKVWLSGGVTGKTYKVTVTVTTTDGRIKQDEFKVKVKEI